jgi:hypothetical protein
MEPQAMAYFAWIFERPFLRSSMELWLPLLFTFTVPYEGARKTKAN